MRKLYLACAAMLALSCTTVASRAQINNPIWCEWSAGAYRSVVDTQKVQVVSFCETVGMDVTRAFANHSDEALGRAIEVWEKQMGKDNLPERASLYWLIVANNRKAAVEVLFPDPAFLHSPYTWTHGSTTFRLKGCEQVVVGFISPHRPAVKSFQGVQGFARSDWPGWATDTFGEVLIVMPREGSLFAHWKNTNESISKENASKNTECTFDK